MTTESNEGAATGAESQAAPSISIVTQYAKDLSFENPKAPFGLQQQDARPEIQIRVDVRAQQLNAEQFEVLLEVNVDAKASNENVFLVELHYGGIFRLANIPQDSLQPLLMIECPRMLFPFARRIIADVTRDGGFPPLMIDPIDFVALYQQSAQAQGGAQQAMKPN